MDPQLAALVVVATAYAKNPNKAEVAKQIHGKVKQLLRGEDVDVFGDIEMTQSALVEVAGAVHGV